MAQDIRHVLTRFDQMKTARLPTEAYWQQTADYMLPSREFTRHTSPGSRRTATLIYNTHPVSCLEQLAGALHGMLTSPALRWAALQADQPGLSQIDDVRIWFEACTDILFQYFNAAESGFDVALHELYLDLAGMGTGCMFIADAGRKGVRFEARPLSECFVSQGHDGRIDTLIRSYNLPAREVIGEWPKTVPAKIKAIAETRPDEPIEMLHAVIPTEGKLKWDSVYIARAYAAELEASTFNSFPFAVPRWMKRSGETYGFGPGMNALPDAKLLNKLEELNLRGLAKLVDPALLLPDDGFLNAPTTQPGQFNYFRSGAPGMDKIGPLQTGGRPDLANNQIKLIQDRISRIFYIDWLSLPDQPNMTATEVVSRRDQMLRLLSPMVSRVTAELLGVVIGRTFEVLAANNMLPPPPQVLAGRGYGVKYTSPLATAQLASDAEAVMRWIGAIAQLAQVDPTAVDVVDIEGTARFLATRYGAPASLVRSQQAIEARREAEAQKAQQQHDMAAAQAAASTAKDGTQALGNLAAAFAPQPGSQPPANTVQGAPQPAFAAAA